MKKIYYLLWMLPMLFALGGCEDKEEIVFDHERQMFELKSDAILLEVIMPKGTNPADELYIVGAFNGGEEEAVGQLQWRLEKASASDVNWGIYLYPSAFANGKTLADGFYFVSKDQGGERTIKNEVTTHTLDAKVGTRSLMMVSRWKKYFDSPDDEEEHDGFAVYVEDNTGWDALALYAWMDGGDATPSWPGLQVTGTKTIGKATYKYFDMGKALDNKVVNLIFNNNNAGKQFNGPQVTLNRDYYFRITDSGFEEVTPTTYAGYTVYVDDRSGWDALALYGWADGGDVTPGWPGIQVTGTKVINGVTYKYFEMGETLNDRFINMIFNNNGKGKQFDGPKVTLDRDFYLRITDSKCEEVDPNAKEKLAIYVEDNSGWNALALYFYGDGVADIGWPGLQMAGTKVINNVTYKYFEISESMEGKVMNAIFNNNNGGAQFDGPQITLNRNYYFRITANTCKEVDPNATDIAVYVQDNSGWSALALYCYGDGVADIGWPGMQVAGTRTIEGVTYKYFEIGAALAGKSVNLIFNNNNNGAQFDGPYVTLDKSLFFSITATTCTPLTSPLK